MIDRPGQGRNSASQKAVSRSRPVAKLLMLAVCAALAFSGFVALGTWQLQRLQWKLGLIERVEQRVHAAPVAAPGPDRWPQVNAAADEYRHVSVTGIFLYELTTKVQASTELGSGYWLLTPLRNLDGTVVLVNRGFIPAGDADQSHNDLHNGAHVTEGHQNHDDRGLSIVTGLLRISEPGGAFLRNNNPSGNWWYSRDIQAIAVARGLSRVAPYFVDADATKETGEEKPGSNSANYPIGGLTVISFHNNHLVYALTWYALALMVAGAGLRVAREERSRHRVHGTRSGYIDQESENGMQY
ncbi:MAG: hypothetical protein JWQ21_2637 [Herminiimonas sp.]|nr:hypothetical protein [Herminiimonas sp.]